jgi:hypothetical protein
MKKLVCLLFLFLHNIVFSTIIEPLSLDLGLGYREDHFKWNITSDTLEKVLFYQERYKHPRYLQTNLSLKAIQRDLYFFYNFAYSFFGKGQMHQKIKDANLYSFDYKNKGRDIETELEVGYAVDLTSGRIEKFILIPLFGYSGFWKSFKREDSHPTYQNSGLLISSNLSKNLKEVWYGPYLGVNLEFIPSEIVIFNLGYHFNWLKLKHKSTSELVETSNSLVVNDYKIINGFFSGHSDYAFGKITYVCNKNCKIAFLGKFDYFISNKDKANVSFVQKENDASSDLSIKNNFFARWWYGFLGTEIIFQF